MTDRPVPRTVEKAVLAHLSGIPLDKAASQATMQVSDLTDALQLYRAAGYAALVERTHHSDWHQLRIEFPDWSTAEQTAVAHLRPVMYEAEGAGAVSSWWFIRKAPNWRLRCQPGPATTLAELKTRLTYAFDNLVVQGHIVRWRESIYEPETYAFGGSESIRVAHTLFHADSCGILNYLQLQAEPAVPEHRIGRREVSVLLMSVLFRSARQEWSEQGDIWHQVAQMRPAPSGARTLGQLHQMTPTLRHLMTLDVSPVSPLLRQECGPLAHLAGWITAVEEVGGTLGRLAQDGRLDRGVREILARHVIFHWNRIGLPTRTQSILALAAQTAVMGS